MTRMKRPRQIDGPWRAELELDLEWMKLYPTESGLRIVKFMTEYRGGWAIGVTTTDTHVHFIATFKEIQGQ